MTVQEKLMFQMFHSNLGSGGLAQMRMLTRVFTARTHKVGNDKNHGIFERRCLKIEFTHHCDKFLKRVCF